MQWVSLCPLLVLYMVAQYAIALLWSSDDIDSQFTHCLNIQYFFHLGTTGGY